MKRVFQERGFDFAYAARAFFDPDRTIQAGTRSTYGEDRYQLMGKIEQRLLVVVYTPRHDAIRIISARKANRREVRHYENSTRDN
ncbi:BrnT family toxin [Azoarcus sp. PA01]|nr:BrnT family toxin [Azoarcus sp. PA01]